MNILAELATKKIIQQGDIVSIEKEVLSSGKSLEQVLEKRGVSPQDLLSVKGEIFKVPTKTVKKEELSREVLGYIPEESARHYKFVPIKVNDGVLEVGVLDTENIEELDALNFISSKIDIPYKIFLISEADFNTVLEVYKGLSGEVEKALQELGTELEIEKISSPKGGENEISKEGYKKEVIVHEDAPVTKIVATILRYAVEGEASDIHIEPMEEKIRVRFRVDGILHTSLILPLTVQRAIVSRIKILSSMKLDESRKPQDGRFSANIGEKKIEFRVSTFPSSKGEKVVMRILDPTKGSRSLDKIGFSKEGVEMIKNALRKPYGLVLISGPTGSGKSSTLYAMLQEVERDTRNVVSLEDPVEYNIEGVSQSQVFPEIGYTFATGLRSILRQDPDIIMVGEIRDKETAQLAIQAALTGHLVFSTLHTNNVAGVIPRLVDMGVDPFLIAPTLVLAIAQRLVRTLCPGGGEEVEIKGSLKLMLEKQFEDLPQDYRKNINLEGNIYKIKPTPECPNGTRGRTAVVEILEMDDELEKVILTNPVENEIYAAGRKKGMLTMKEDAIIKCVQRLIPFEEVNKLGGELLISEDAPVHTEKTLTFDATG